MDHSDEPEPTDQNQVTAGQATGTNTGAVLILPIRSEAEHRNRHELENLSRFGRQNQEASNDTDHWMHYCRNYCVAHLRSGPCDSELPPGHQ